jgi:hypothetical protein
MADQEGMARVDPGGALVTTKPAAVAWGGNRTDRPLLVAGVMGLQALMAYVRLRRNPVEAHPSKAGNSAAIAVYHALPKLAVVHPTSSSSPYER